MTIKKITVGDTEHTIEAASCTGNSATATKFASNQTVALSGDVTGSVSSQAGWSVSTTLANSGVTAGNYGPSANATPAHSGSFSVPYITVDAKGRVTAASTKTITLPGSGNTDTQVTQTISSTNINYPILFSGSTSTNTGGVYKNANVTLNPSTNTITATTFSGALSGNATSATKLGSSTVGGASQPIYLSSGTATKCSTYAGGTAVTLNNSSKAGSTASFYAPTSGGTSGYFLVGAGTTAAPTWITKGTTLLNNMGITWGTAAPSSTGTAGTIYIQYT